jgi:general secretion pathway protein K
MLVKQADGTVDEDALAAFRKLLTMLDLEPKWAPLIADWIDEGIEPYRFDGGEDNLYLTQVPAYRPPNRLITSTSELLALPGFGRDRYLRLRNYITALPQNTPLNMCTAHGLVLDAFIATENDDGEIQYSTDEENMAKSRQNGCPQELSDFKESRVRSPTLKALVGTKSNYFRLTSVVTVGDTQFALYSVMFRDGAKARPILRTYTPD